MKRRPEPDVLPEQPEEEFQDDVLRLAELNGWSLRYHTHDSRRSEAGYPDLTLVKPGAGRLLLAELKRESGRLSTKQQEWIDGLKTVSYFDVRIWRPSDWPEIERFLR